MTPSAQSPSPHSRWALPLTLIAVTIVCTWPIALNFNSALPSPPSQEAATHLWGLWAALQTRHPLINDTALLAWPSGTHVVLVDPGNLLWFSLGNLVGPIAGYNAVVMAGVALMGLAGAMLAREVGGNPILGAVIGASTPTTLGHIAEGMTECSGVGWVGIHLALLLSFRRTGAVFTGISSVAALAMAWYTGPYNGVWAALLGSCVGAASLSRIGTVGWKPLARTAAVGAGGLCAVAPLAYAVLLNRADSMPGSASRAGIPPIREWPDRFRGGLEHGADLLDPLVPVALTGGEAPTPHTAYLGILTVIGAVWVASRHRKLRIWLLGAVAFSALSLGPWLYAGGEVVTVADTPIPGPAGLLMQWVPGLDRLNRWYRAGAIAGLLLTALASRWSAGHPIRQTVFGALVFLDATLGAPVIWPLTQTAPPSHSPYSRLEKPGALLEIPPATTGEPPPAAWRDRNVLAQAFHARPIGGGAMGIAPSDAARAAQHRVEGVLRGGSLPKASAAKIQSDGFSYIAFYTQYRQIPAEGHQYLEACFGSPVHRSREVWIYDVSAAVQDGCAGGRARSVEH